MIAIGQGRLKLSPRVATDGVIYFKVFSPGLKRIMKHIKRDLSVVGNFICIGDRIVFFKKS